MPSEPDAPAERPPHVKLVKGRWYWDPPDRLRKSHGLKTHALGGDQSAAWAYARILNRDNLQLGPDAPIVGSVAWLFASFVAGERFKSLQPNTQRDYRWITERVLGKLTLGNRELGRYPAMAIKPRHADQIYSMLLEKHGHSAAHYACRVARRIWKWGARREIVDANPWTSMELKSIPQREQRWTPGQVDAFRAKAKELNRPSLALAVSIAYWIGHRQGDVIGLTWTSLDNGEVKTGKTGKVVPVVVAAYPELAAELEAERVRQRDSKLPSTHVVVCEMTKQPWQRHTFGHEFRSVARAAGLPDEIQFRDLRATALTELSDAGVGVISMSTHSGHSTTQMARRYARRTSAQFTQAAEQRRDHLDAARNKKATDAT